MHLTGISSPLQDSSVFPVLQKPVSQSHLPDSLAAMMEVLRFQQPDASMEDVESYFSDRPGCGGILFFLSRDPTVQSLAL